MIDVRRLFWNQYTSMGSTMGNAAEYRAVVELLNAGKRGVLVYPIPETGWDVPPTLFKMRINRDNGSVTTSYSAYRKRSYATVKAFDEIGERSNLIRVFPEKIFCDNGAPGRCITSKGNELYYIDDDHMSLTGAQLIVSEIFEQTDSIWGS